MNGPSGLRKNLPDPPLLSSSSSRRRVSKDEENVSCIFCTEQKHFFILHEEMNYILFFCEYLRDWVPFNIDKVIATKCIILIFKKKYENHIFSLVFSHLFTRLLIS